VQTRFLHLFGDFSQPAISRHMSGNSADISKRYFRNCTVGSNPPWSAIDLGSRLSSAFDQPQNPQQTGAFQVNDRTGDYRRDGNLRLETTFFSKASYFAVLVQF